MLNNIDDLLVTITPDIYQNLKRAVELGKWPNGLRLNREQRELCMQAMIAWEKKNLEPAHRSGFIPQQPHAHCGDSKPEIADDEEQPLQFR